LIFEQEIIISLKIFFWMKSPILLFAIFIFMGCRPVKIVDENVAITEKKDEVVFMAFKIEKDDQSQNNIVSLINTTQTNAKIKKQSEPESHSGNYLIAEISASGKPLQTIKIAHPLYQHFEYPDDSGKYISKDAVLDEAEFFIRFQSNGANKIRWSELRKDQLQKELLTINF